MRVIVAIASIMLCCCAYQARQWPPEMTIQAKSSLDDTSRCLIRGMDEALKSASLIGSLSLTHAIQIRDPGRVYEIAPQQTLEEGGEAYFVRVTAIPSGSEIQLYGTQGFVRALRQPVLNCQN